MKISRLLMATVGEAEVIPRGYGLAYRDYARAEGIFYLIPFNLVARLGLWLYCVVAYGLYPNRFEVKLRNEYSRGRKEAWDWTYKDGYESGKKNGWVGCAKETNRRLDEYLAMSQEERREFKGWQ